MAESYIKFKVSNDVVSRTYEALQISKQTGKVKKGINEVTKSAERGIASLVVIAEERYIWSHARYLRERIRIG